jgi:uncharacterized protein (DUF1499 family)
MATHSVRTAAATTVPERANARQPSAVSSRAAMRYGRAMRNAIGVVAALAMVIGPLLAHFGVIAPLAGFALFALGGLVAIVVGLASVVQLVRGRSLTLGGALCVLGGVAFVGIASGGRGYPRINDFTTDTADPPAFQQAATLPPNVGRNLGYPASFAAIQQACCADLHPATLAVPPADAYERALRTARAMPTWTVTRADPAAAAIEAVDTSRLFHFQDDVVIRVRPDGAGSRVDVRSKSRDGQGDLGVNAKRIRAYVDALEAAR